MRILPAMTPRHDDAHLLTVLADFAVGGYVSAAAFYRLQVRGWVRVDRYDSPVLTHAGVEAVKGSCYEQRVKR